MYKVAWKIVGVWWRESAWKFINIWRILSEKICHRDVIITMRNTFQTTPVTRKIKSICFKKPQNRQYLAYQNLQNHVVLLQNECQKYLVRQSLVTSGRPNGQNLSKAVISWSQLQRRFGGRQCGILLIILTTSESKLVIVKRPYYTANHIQSDKSSDISSENLVTFDVKKSEILMVIFRKFWGN